MLVGQVDLVSRAVEAEADDLAVAVLDDGVVQVVDQVATARRAMVASSTSLVCSVDSGIELTTLETET